MAKKTLKVMNSGSVANKANRVKLLSVRLSKIILEVPNPIRSTIISMTAIPAYIELIRTSGRSKDSLCVL
jgi:hypothetical protein